jgi:hypothetical protein
MEEGKNLPGITTFLTSLLTMRTSDPNLCSLLPRWRDVVSFSFLSVVIMVLVLVSIVVVLMVWW